MIATNLLGVRVRFEHNDHASEGTVRAVSFVETSSTPGWYKVVMLLEHDNGDLRSYTSTWGTDRFTVVKEAG